MARRACCPAIPCPTSPLDRGFRWAPEQKPAPRIGARSHGAAPTVWQPCHEMPPLRDVLILEAVRTPVGRGHPEKGALKDVHPADLLGQTYVGLLDRAGVDSAQVDNVIAGCVYQIAEQSTGITRSAWLQKGLAETT